MILFNRKSQTSLNVLLHVSYTLLPYSLVDIKPQKRNLAIKEKRLKKARGKKVGKCAKNFGKSCKNVEKKKVPKAKVTKNFRKSNKN